MDEYRVRLFIGDREVFSAPLRPMGNSASGKTVKLASDPSGRAESPFPAFSKLGWTLTCYGVPRKADEIAQVSTETVNRLQREIDKEDE